MIELTLKDNEFTHIARQDLTTGCNVRKLNAPPNLTQRFFRHLAEQPRDVATELRNKFREELMEALDAIHDEAGEEAPIGNDILIALDQSTLSFTSRSATDTVIEGDLHADITQGPEALDKLRFFALINLRKKLDLLIASCLKELQLNIDGLNEDIRKIDQIIEGKRIEIKKLEKTKVKVIARGITTPQTKIDAQIAELQAGIQRQEEHIKILRRYLERFEKAHAALISVSQAMPQTTEELSGQIVVMRQLLTENDFTKHLTSEHTEAASIRELMTRKAVLTKEINAGKNRLQAVARTK